jgi:hypothetical protein
VTTKKVKKTVNHIPHPIQNLTVTYTPGTDSVTLYLPGTQTFPTGGQLVVKSGLTSALGGPITGRTVFTIGKGGKTID